MSVRDQLEWAPDPGAISSLVTVMEASRSTDLCLLCEKHLFHSVTGGMSACCTEGLVP